MLSKNNFAELMRKQEPKKQRFTIKKLTVGVASVLIGFTFMGMSALADDNVNAAPQSPATAEVTNVQNNSSAASSAQSTTQSANVQSSQSATSDATTNLLNVQAAQPANVNAIQENKVKDNTAVNVDDYAGFLSALGNKDVTTINLTGDITKSGHNDYDSISTKGVARNITINGQNHQLNFDNHYIWLTTNTQTGTNGWHITFANLANIEATNKGYGLIGIQSNDPSKNSIVFQNVTINADNAITGTHGGNINVTFVGNNTIKGTLTGTNALIYSHDLNIKKGVTTVTPTANSATQATAFSVAGNVTVDGNAQLNINSTVQNVAGITFTAGAKDKTIDNATVGVVCLLPKAQVTINLGAGKSMAIMRASDIDLQDDSALKVNTKMDTTGFRALAPVELDSTQNDAYDSTVRVGNNATLSIIRQGVAVSDSPLLSMGPNDGLGN